MQQSSAQLLKGTSPLIRGRAMPRALLTARTYNAAPLPRSLGVASPPSSNAAGVTLHLQVHKRVNYGDNLRVVGDSNLLGNWVPDQAVRMQWTAGDVWVTDLQLPPGTYEFKVVVYNDRSRKAAWEPGYNKVVQVPDTPWQMQLDCQWGTAAYQASVLPERLSDDALLHVDTPGAATQRADNILPGFTSMAHTVPPNAHALRIPDAPHAANSEAVPTQPPTRPSKSPTPERAAAISLLGSAMPIFAGRDSPEHVISNSASAAHTSHSKGSNGSSSDGSFSEEGSPEPVTSNSVSVALTSRSNGSIGRGSIVTRRKTAPGSVRTVRTRKSRSPKEEADGTGKRLAAAGVSAPIGSIQQVEATALQDHNQLLQGPAQDSVTHQHSYVEPKDAPLASEGEPAVSHVPPVAQRAAAAAADAVASAADASGAAPDVMAAAATAELPVPITITAAGPQLLEGASNMHRVTAKVVGETAMSQLQSSSKAGQVYSKEVSATAAVLPTVQVEETLQADSSELTSGDRLVQQAATDHHHGSESSTPMATTGQGATTAAGYSSPVDIRGRSPDASKAILDAASQAAHGIDWQKSEQEPQKFSHQPRPRPVQAAAADPGIPDAYIEAAVDSSSDQQTATAGSKDASSNAAGMPKWMVGMLKGFFKSPLMSSLRSSEAGTERMREHRERTLRKPAPAEIKKTLAAAVSTVMHAERVGDHDNVAMQAVRSLQLHGTLRLASINPPLHAHTHTHTHTHAPSHHHPLPHHLHATSVASRELHPHSSQHQKDKSQHDDEDDNHPPGSMPDTPNSKPHPSDTDAETSQQKTGMTAQQQMHAVSDPSVAYLHQQLVQELKVAEQDGTAVDQTTELDELGGDVLVLRQSLRRRSHGLYTPPQPLDPFDTTINTLRATGVGLLGMAAAAVVVQSGGEMPTGIQTEYTLAAAEELAVTVEVMEESLAVSGRAAREAMDEADVLQDATLSGFGEPEYVESYPQEGEQQQ